MYRRLDSPPACTWTSWILSTAQSRKLEPHQNNVAQLDYDSVSAVISSPILIRPLR